ncbi:MAG: hypothetical protein IJW40_04380 [Clostridia bacterium]|nr:hypothetical protein [Clostridia bacterium]
MKLVRFELQKLIGLRLLWILLAICLAANVFFCVSAAKDSADRLLPEEQADLIFSAYRADPEQVVSDMEAYYAEEQRLLDLQMQIIISGLTGSGDGDGSRESIDLNPPDTYSTDPSISDRRLFNALETALGASVNYDQTLDGVIATANQNILRCKLMGNSENSFVYVVQTDTIARYTHLKEVVSPEIEYVRGWDGYFAYDRGNIFLLFGVILICSMIFVYDREMRFFPLMRTTSRGRVSAAISKYFAAMVAISVFVIMVTLSNLIVFGSVTGFSSVTNAIQAVPSLVLCPLKLTIWQGILMWLMMQILVFCTLAAVILTLSLFFTSYAPVYLCGFGLYAVNYLLASATYTSANVPAKYVNLIAAADAGTYFERVLHLQVGGYMMTFLPLLLICCGIILCVTLLISVILYCRNVHISARVTFPIRNWLRNLQEKGRALTTRRGKRRNTYPLVLSSAELRKRLSGRTLAVILLLLLGLHLMNDALTPVRSEDDKLYEAYMIELEGELTEEKLRYIEEENEFIRTTLQNVGAMDKKMEQGEITIEEYMAFMEDYHYANSHEDAFAVVLSQVEHLQKIEAQTGIRGELFYTTGWNLYFTQDVSMVMIAALLLLLTGVFSDEYTSHASAGAFAAILRTTKHGRAHTYRAKLLSCMLICIVTSMIYTLAELIILCANWSLPCLDVAVVSMPLFAEAQFTINIFTLLIIRGFLRMLFTVILGLLVACISGVIKRTVAVLMACFALVFLPSVLLQFNVSVPTGLVTMDYLSVMPHIFAGMTENFGGGDLGLPIVLWMLALLVLAVFVVLSARVYIGGKRVHLK